MINVSDEHKLLSICILDGRNKEKMDKVSEYFSEFALIRQRARVEIQYLIFLSKNTHILRKLKTKEIIYLYNIWKDFSIEDAKKVKGFEAKINHDVKAIEYFLQVKLEKTSLKDIIPYIHFGLTSYDVNVPSYALMLKEFGNDILIPQIRRLLMSLKELIIKTKNMYMLGRTHGQPALPTTMGKELSVFYKRVTSEVKILSNHKFEAKLSGAVGNYNALAFVFPNYDWIKLSEKFITSLELIPNTVTTQIMPYDNWLRYFDGIKRLNNILLNLVVDIWWYISFEYFLQKKKEEEVGSSTMSHKINPITFENAEGNLQLANSLFDFFVKKLAVTRLQRDLSDSTVKRDFGLAFGFTLLSWDSILSGLTRISPHSEKMKYDLDNHWEVFSEGIQTYLRSKGLKNAYEVLKKETRGKTYTKKELYKLIDMLPMKGKDKEKLKIKNLSEYSGLAEKLAEIAIK